MLGWHFVLEDPGVPMRNVDCGQARRQCRVDVGTSAVAYHPGPRGGPAVPGNQTGVRRRVLFLENLDLSKEAGET